MLSLRLLNIAFGLLEKVQEALSLVHRPITTPSAFTHNVLGRSKKCKHPMVSLRSVVAYLSVAQNRSKSPCLTSYAQ